MSCFIMHRTFLQNGGPSGCHNVLKRWEKKYFSNGRTIKETDLDWQLGERWEQQYFC